MMIWGLFLLTAIVMKLWPETPSAQWLHQHLVERPLALISRLKRQHLIMLIVGFALLYSFASIGMPHLAMAAAVDVSAYVDAMITATTIAALNRSRGAWAGMLARLPRLGRVSARPRSRRTPAQRTRRKVANDDDSHGAFARAA